MENRPDQASPRSKPPKKNPGLAAEADYTKLQPKTNHIPVILHRAAEGRISAAFAETF